MEELKRQEKVFRGQFLITNKFRFLFFLFLFVSLLFIWWKFGIKCGLWLDKITEYGSNSVKVVNEVSKNVIIFSASYTLFSLRNLRTSTFLHILNEAIVLLYSLVWNLPMYRVNFNVWQRRWGDTADKMPILGEIRNWKISAIWKFDQKSFQTMYFHMA